MAEQPGDGGPGYSWFAVEVTSDPVEPGAFPWPEPVQPPPPVEQPTFGGSGERIVSGGGLGLEEQEFELRIPLFADISLPRHEQITPLVASFTRPIEARFPFEIAVEKPVELRVPVERLSAERWNSLLAEDDELILLGVLG
jgi:hypothetical protein